MSAEGDRVSVIEYWKADSTPDGVPVVRAVEDDGDEDGALAMTGTLEDAEFIAAALNNYRGAVIQHDPDRVLGALNNLRGYRCAEQGRFLAGIDAVYHDVAALIGQLEGAVEAERTRIVELLRREAESFDDAGGVLTLLADHIAIGGGSRTQERPRD